MTFSFMAQTNYQFINIIKFVYFNCENSRGRSDLYIRDNVAKQLINMNSLIDNGLFNHIYIYQMPHFRKNSFVRKLQTFFSILNQKTFHKMILSDFPEYSEYNVLVIPSVSLESEIFWLYFKHQYIYLIEDGLGSITGNIVTDGMSKGRHKLTDILYGKFSLDKMYINNLTFCDSSTKTRIVQIPGNYNDSFCNLLSSLYFPSNYKTTYYVNDVIYLQQPVVIWSEEYPNKEKEVIQECFHICKERFIIRCHPLTITDPRISDIRYDEENYIWELLCLNQINNSNILIGVFSTAQFSPKQLYNKEPFMIFLYKILPPTNVNIASEIKLYELLKQSYQDAERVCAPESIDELKVILKGICSK